MIAFVCSCGKRLKAPQSAAGKKMRCPACKAAVLVSPATAGAVPAPAAASSSCPNCRAAMAANSVLCTNCGYDKRTGMSLTTSATRTAAKQPIDRMAAEGSLLLGVIISAVFALAASVVWIAVAYITGLAIGYIAILIGIAAGIGMQIGQKGYSRTGGIVASAMTVFAIVVAKLVVLEALLMKQGSNKSIFDLDSAKLGFYFLSPIGLIIIVIGAAAAFRTANGSSR